MTNSALAEHVRSIHDSILVLDAHVDMEVSCFAPDGHGANGGDRPVGLERMEAGGVDGAVFVAYVGQGPLDRVEYRRAERTVTRKVQTMRRAATRSLRDRIALAVRAEDVLAIHRGRRKVAIIGVENGYAIGEDLENLRRFSDLGVRYVTLCLAGHNQICDAKWYPSGSERLNGGLSPFGEQVVRVMNALGMIVDVAHVSKETVLDVCSLSKAPVIASHSAVQRIGGVGNLLDDEELDSLKQNGGVVHIMGLRTAVKADSPEKIRDICDLRKDMGLPIDTALFLQEFLRAPEDKRLAYQQRLETVEEKHIPASVQDLVDHIDYVVRRIGIDHVGISSDFYDASCSLAGWRDASETPNVTLELVRRGYTTEQLERIWGGNLLRVWGEVQEAATRRPGPTGLAL